MNQQVRNFVSKLTNDACYVHLESFIDREDEEKSTNLDLILDETKKYKVIFGALVWENRLINSWLPWVLKLREQCPCIFVFDAVYQNQIDEIPEAKFIDFFALRTWFEINVIKSSVQNDIWNPHTGKFLFLTGKPHGLHRAAFLKKLIDNNLIDCCIWSLFINDGVNEELKQSLGFTDNNELENFIRQYNRSPDNIVPLKSIGTTIHYGGFPYDYTLYQKSSFKVISETQFELQGPWITEKTWITIANSHPFLIAANKGTLHELENKNIRCFREYLAIPGYNEISNPGDKVEAIITNIKTFLKNVSRYRHEIQADINHNSRSYNTLIHKNLKIILDLCRILDISLDDLYQSGFFSDIVDMKWLLFYNNVKDPTWPKCLSERHFEQLPIYIKQELINDFGFCL